MPKPLAKMCKECKQRKLVADFFIPGNSDVRRCDACRSERTKRRKEQKSNKRARRKKRLARRGGRPEIGLRKKQKHLARHMREDAAGGPTYRQRDLLLTQLGFRNYAEYRESNLWKAIRSKVYAIKGRVCLLCQAKAHCIHHVDYGQDTLLGKNLNSLVPVCDTCHGLIEHDSNGVKRSLAEAQQEYRRLLLSLRSL